MRKLFVLMALMLFTFSAAAYGAENETEERYIDAAEAGQLKVPIDGLDGYYIMADPTGSYVNIVDAAGSKLTDTAFKAVYNKVDVNTNQIKVRYYNTDDISGFAVLDKNLEEIIAENDYYFLTSNFRLGDLTVVGEKRVDGVLTPYNFLYYDGGLIYFNYGSGSLVNCDDWAESSLKKAEDAGLIPTTFYYRNFKDAVTRFDLAYIAVQAYILKNNTDISTYIAENKISLSYDKYIDIAAPDILIAEELGLIRETGDKYFNPDEIVSRQEAAYTFNRLCELLGIKTSTREVAFNDDTVIADWAKEAVYSVSGTRTEDTYLMAATAGNNFAPNDSYSLERAILTAWRIYAYDDLGISEVVVKDTRSIGCGVCLFQNSEGKWGAMTEDETIIVEPLYELAGATEAVSNVFILSDTKNVFSGRNNTYYIFDTAGNLLKTLHYGEEEMAADGRLNSDVYVTYASGSNLVFREHLGDMVMGSSPDMEYYIKRLMSEKVAATDYYDIEICGGGLFTAKERTTDKEVILNADGSFKSYK